MLIALVDGYQRVALQIDAAEFPPCSVTHDVYSKIVIISDKVSTIFLNSRITMGTDADDAGNRYLCMTARTRC